MFALMQAGEIIELVSMRNTRELTICAGCALGATRLLARTLFTRYLNSLQQESSAQSYPALGWRRTTILCDCS